MFRRRREDRAKINRRVDFEIYLDLDLKYIKLIIRLKTTVFEIKSTTPMEIKYNSDNGKIMASLSDESDWNLFNRIADLIAKEFNGYWIEKIDGLDNRYWDIAIENVILTLHLEHYLGISLFPKYSDVKAKFLIQRIGNYLETQIP